LEYAEKASETSGNHAAFVADMIEAAENKPFWDRFLAMLRARDS
jgi:hypothetical protein